MITLQTMANQIGGKASTVRVYVDALLYDMRDSITSDNASSFTGYLSSTANLYAISMIGPEQSVRAIAAGCSLENKYSRTRLLALGSDRRYTCLTWAGRWTCRARLVADGFLHMVAMPEISFTSDLASGDVPPVVMALPVDREATPSDLRNALYERLLLAYTTPLIPVNAPGQSDAERRAALRWREKITGRIMNDPDLWQPLQCHPDLPSREWGSAGLLSMTPAQLDAIVTEMIKVGVLDIPEVTFGAAVAQKQAG